MNKKILKISLISIASLLAASYVGGAVYFYQHFYPKTSVDNVDVSYDTVDDGKTKILNDLNNYTLKINTIDGDEEIKGSDIDLKWKSNISIENVKKEQGFLSWPLGFLKNSKFSSMPSCEYDEKKLDDIYNKLNIFDKEKIIKPENARIVADDEGIKVKKEIEGNEVKKKELLKLVKKDIKNNINNINIKEENLYKKPKIYSDNKSIVGPMKTLSKYNNARIDYEIDGENISLTPKDILGFFNIKNDKAVLDKDKIKNYVIALARKIDTWSLDRPFMNSYGKKIIVGGGSYGFLVERSDEVEQIIKDIMSNKLVKREPIYRYKAKTRGENDIGKNYIEIDLYKQHMWCYKDGKLVADTPIVSGKMTADRYTPTGVYPITYKQKNAILRGPNYATKVGYWMPFNGSIGVHDAVWRSKFGGEIYVNGGSHGCINTPLNKVIPIYNAMEKGDPVVVYYSNKAKPA